MLVIRRKELLVVGVAALVAAAGYLNWIYGDKAEETAETLGEVRLVSSDGTAEDKDFFSEARLDREVGRSESVASLTGIIESDSVGAEGKSAAENEMVKLATLSETESAVENMIMAKGFEDAVIYISDGTVTAVVKSDALDSAAAAQIVDTITASTGIAAENIRIIEAR